MKRMHWSLIALAVVCLGAAEERAFDPELAKRLGADERGMKMYVLCILKTGPKDAEKLVVLDPAVKAGVFVPELTPWYGTAAMMVVNDTHKRIEKPAAK